MHLRATLCLLSLLALPVGCKRSLEPTATAPALAGSPAHPNHAGGWVETRLYFGLGPADHPDQGINEAQWRDFLDKEVTPRFPAGLSVLDAYGQWKDTRNTALERLRSRLLVIAYPDNAENRAAIDAIRTAWKRRTGDQSVLSVTEPADVSF
jgi:hypothetical protein